MKIVLNYLIYYKFYNLKNEAKMIKISSIFQFVAVTSFLNALNNIFVNHFLM